MKIIKQKIATFGLAALVAVGALTLSSSLEALLVGDVDVNISEVYSGSEIFNQDYTQSTAAQLEVETSEYFLQFTFFDSRIDVAIVDLDERTAAFPSYFTITFSGLEFVDAYGNLGFLSAGGVSVDDGYSGPFVENPTVAVDGANVTGFVLDFAVERGIQGVSVSLSPEYTTTAIPEPGTYLLLGSTLGLMMLARRKRLQEAA